MSKPTPNWTPVPESERSPEFDSVRCETPCKWKPVGGRGYCEVPCMPLVAGNMAWLSEFNRHMNYCPYCRRPIEVLT